MSVRDECARGWREGRWSWYFTLALFPLSLVCAFLAHGIAAVTGWTEHGLLIGFMIPASCVSYIYAGLRDGPFSRYGRHVWIVACVLVIVFWMRQAEARQGALKGRVAGHDLEYRPGTGTFALDQTVMGTFTLNRALWA